MPTHTSPSRYARTYGTSTTLNESSETDGQWDIPALVKGTWITFADGSRFRRSTNYARYRVMAERRDSALSVGRRTVNNYAWRAETGPGGYGFTNFFSGNFIYAFNGELDLPSILGAPAFSSNARNKAVVSALNDLGDNKAQIGENLATFAQIVRMFKNPTRLFYNGVKALKNDSTMRKFLRMSYRDLRRAGIPEVIAQKYLEYVYGFKPLMQDIYGVYELTKEFGQKPLLLRGTGRAFETGTVNKKIQYPINIGSTTNRVDSWLNTRFQSRTNVTLWARLNDDYQVLRVLNQMGLLNPASFVWELVPFSFIVDWALPLGPFFSALSAPTGLTFVNGSVSRRLTAVWDGSISYPAVAGYQAYSIKPGTSQFRYDGYRREAITSWPVPRPFYDADPLRLAADGSDRVFKALALAVVNSPTLLTRR